MKQLLLLLLLLPSVTHSTEIPRDINGSISRSPLVLSQFQKAFPCPVTNKRSGACPGFVKDHIRPLCSGGHDSVENLKWSETGYSKLRDVQEWKLCNSLKKQYGTISLDEPKDYLCNIIHKENLSLIKEICK